MPDWLELELAHRLAPAKAPNDLWERVQTGGPRRPVRPPVRRRVWPVAAIVTVMIAAGAMWMVAKGQGHVPDLAHLASMELNAGEPLDLQSGDPADVRAWAKRSAGVDLKITPASCVELRGARLIRHRGERMAAVAYAVDGRPAALLIASTFLKGNTPHAGMAIAGADSACRICHSSL